jgi:hypothetical protein
MLLMGADGLGLGGFANFANCGYANEPMDGNASCCTEYWAGRCNLTPQAEMTLAAMDELDRADATPGA